MQGNVDALNKNAFISMFIQKPLSKEHPVLACVCGRCCHCWWRCLVLGLGMWCWFCGNGMCWAGLLHAMSCSWPGGEAAAAALLGATAA